MSPRRWFGRLVERHRERRVDPWTAEQMDSFRCRVWRLIQAARS